MNNNQYIAALHKSLSGLEKTSREDIIHEIQSHADESGDTLRERFGAPEDLAQQYLEGEVVATPLGATMWGISKKLLIAIGAAVVALTIIASLIFWWAKRDAFNYEDENATELTDKNTAWTAKAWTDNLELSIDEASVVFYWHDDANISYSCDNQPPVGFDGPSLTFTRAKCLVYLPKVSTTINAHRAQVVLVRPQQSLDLELNQVDLKIAEDGTAYRYFIDSSRTSFNGLSSVESAELEIRIKSFESSISRYSY